VCGVVIVYTNFANSDASRHHSAKFTFESSLTTLLSRIINRINYGRFEGKLKEYVQSNLFNQLTLLPLYAAVA